MRARQRAGLVLDMKGRQLCDKEGGGLRVKGGEGRAERAKAGRAKRGKLGWCGGHHVVVPRLQRMPRATTLRRFLCLRTAGRPPDVLHPST